MPPSTSPYQRTVFPSIHFIFIGGALTPSTVNNSMGWNFSLPNIPYGAQFRKHRRWMMEYFNEKAILRLQPLQRTETNTLLLGLIETPEEFVGHMRR